MSKFTIDMSKSGERQCPEGILSAYLEFTENSEPPEDYHLWGIISLIAMLLGRKCYFPRGAWNLYPNLYIIFVGESGLARKSTTLRYVAQFLAQCDDKGEIEKTSDKSSPEYFLHNLAERYKETDQSEAYVFSSELSNFLGKTRLDDSFLKILTDLYDCPETPWSYGTLTRGKETIANVFINILGGTTEEWLQNSLPEEALGGGFFSRLILVNRPTTGKKIANPEDYYGTENDALMRQIVHDLRIIRNMQGKFSWSPAAKDAWTNWYEDYNNPTGSSHFMRGYFGRKGDFVIKIAMALSASLRSNRIIEMGDFNTALDLLAKNEEFLQDLIDSLSSSQTGRLIHRVEELIKKNSPIKRSALLNRTSAYMVSGHLDQILETLEQSDKIYSETIKSSRGRHATYYMYIKDKSREQINRELEVFRQSLHEQRREDKLR